MSRATPGCRRGDRGARGAAGRGLYRPGLPQFGAQQALPQVLEFTHQSGEVVRAVTRRGEVRARGIHSAILRHEGEPQQSRKSRAGCARRGGAVGNRAVDQANSESVMSAIAVARCSASSTLCDAIASASCAWSASPRGVVSMMRG